jgi:hypothetical protein
MSLIVYSVCHPWYIECFGAIHVYAAVVWFIIANTGSIADQFPTIKWKLHVTGMIYYPICNKQDI